MQSLCDALALTLTMMVCEIIPNYDCTTDPHTVSHRERHRLRREIKDCCYLEYTGDSACAGQGIIGGYTCCTQRSRAYFHTKYCILLNLIVVETAAVEVVV